MQKGRGGRKKRVPFSFSALLSSSTYKNIAVPGSMDANPSMSSNAGPHRVNLGTWAVDQVQLCEMGRKDADGAYKSVGSISLRQAYFKYLSNNVPYVQKFIQAQPILVSFSLLDTITLDTVHHKHIALQAPQWSLLCGSLQVAVIHCTKGCKRRL